MMHLKDRTQEAFIKHILVHQIDQVISWTRSIHSNQKDSEPVHQLRVNLRHLRALLQFFRPWLNKTWVKATNLELKRIATLFSDVREMDVLCEWVEEFTSDTSAEILQNRLYPVRNQIHDLAVEQFDVEKFVKFLLQTNQEILNYKDPQDDEEFYKNVRARVNDWTNHILENQENMNLDDYPMMHTYRISVKKLRYVLTSFKSADVKAFKEVEPMKQLAKALGILTDVEFIKQRFNEIKMDDWEGQQEFYHYLSVKQNEAYTQCVRILEIERSTL